MDRKEFIERLFEEGKRLGIDEMEVFFQENEKLDLGVFEGDIDKYTVSDEQGISFRGIYKDKMGYSYTEKIDEESIKILIDELMDNAKSIDSDDKEIIFKGSENYRNVNCYNDDLKKIDTKQKIEFTKDMEKQALALDERIVAVNHCIFGEGYTKNRLVNTKGLDLQDSSNVAYAYISVMAKENDDVKTAGNYVISNDFRKFNSKILARKAVEEAISMLGAKSIKSDNYKIILRNDVAANILEAFTPIFSADNVQKKLSLLKGKIDEKVANDRVTIIDDPFMSKGVASRSFDSEGVATKYKKIIRDGVLKTYLHNLKTAKKAGVESTGNGHKGSYKSPISIAPTNMYIEKGDKELEDMISILDNGLLIINVTGLHAGLNTVSGDFSLSAYGYEIKNGEIKRPVNQITIADNYFELLKKVDCIGNDLKFSLPSGSGYIGSPSLLIRNISVSGE